MGLYEQFPYVNFHGRNNAWLLQQMRTLSTEWLATKSDWGDMKTAFAELKAYVQNYFATLDLSEEVSQALDNMAESGELDTIIARYIYQKQAIVNIETVVPDRILTNDNITEAINTALDMSSYIYVPKGSFKLNMTIERDCRILFDKDCFIYTETAEPCIDARNCSIQIEGGNFYSGQNDDSRYFVDYPNTHGKTLSLLNFTDCTNSSVKNINVPWNKLFFAVYAWNCTNFEVSDSSFTNLLNSAVHFSEHCVDVAVRNCYFRKSRWCYDASGNLRTYCYFVYTGIKRLNDWEYIVYPVDGLIYENNYCEDSEDCALDTHGARNVIIRNNTIINTVNAITAYNDTNRVKRPSDWKMENVLIENNYCRSNKQIAEDTEYPHSYFFLGSSNNHSREDGATWMLNPGSYSDFMNCVVRNNYIQTRNNEPYVIRLGRVSQNIIFENNYIDIERGTAHGGGSSIYAIGGERQVKTIFRNNTFVNNDLVLIGRNSRVDIDAGNTRGNASFSNLQQITTPNGMYYAIKQGTVSGGGETIRTGEQTFSQVVGYGLRVNDNYTGINEFTVTIQDGVCTKMQHNLLKDLSLNLRPASGTGDSYNVYIVELIDMDLFKINNSNISGTYIATLRECVQIDNQTPLVPARCTSFTNLRAQPDNTAEVIGSLNTGELCLVANRTSEFLGDRFKLVVKINNGAFVIGYGWSDFIEKIPLAF